MTAKHTYSLLSKSLWLVRKFRQKYQILLLDIWYFMVLRGSYVNLLFCWVLISITTFNLRWSLVMFDFVKYCEEPFWGPLSTLVVFEASRVKWLSCMRKPSNTLLSPFIVCFKAGFLYFLNASHKEKETNCDGFSSLSYIKSHVRFNNVHCTIIWNALLKLHTLAKSWQIFAKIPHVHTYIYTYAYRGRQENFKHK